MTTDDSDGEDYRGQDALDDLYTPTLDDPAIDDQFEAVWRLVRRGLKADGPTEI